MTDEPETTSAAPDPAPRPVSAVLGIIAALIAVPLLILLLLLVLRGDSDTGSGDVAGGVRDNRLQAVYMANDRVFFGDVEELSGEWFELRDAYYLRRSAAEAAAEGEGEQEATTTDLVPIQQEVGGDGDMLVNSREVVLVQDLAADSDISRKIEDALK